MFENIECGPCNDGICDWMPCTFPDLCICTHTEENEMPVTKKIVEDEALGKDVTFEYDGVEYTVPSAKQWPLEALEAQEDQKIIAFTKALISEEKYKELRKTAKTVGDFENFTMKLFEAVGTDTGK